MTQNNSTGQACDQRNLMGAGKEPAYGAARKRDQLESVFAEKAASDPGYAIAYALLRVAEAHRTIAGEVAVDGGALVNLTDEVKDGLHDIATSIAPEP
jgi:hypothetical protein